MNSLAKNMSTEFGGDKKVGKSLLSGPETRLKKWLVPKIPLKVETYQLILATLLWSAINVVIAFQVRHNLVLLWIVSVMILLQYLTDLLDGEVGRQRDTGLVKWGFYMDHFLDFIFLCSLVFVGYMIAPPDLEVWIFALLVILVAFMINSFLSFGATNKFEIFYYGIGPTETRIVFILINMFIINFGTGNLHILLPVTVAVCLSGLIFNIYQIQKKLWLLDMGVSQ